MDNTPEHYDNVCQKALDVQKEFSLTDTQMFLYNHICRGDFKLRNSDGQKFYDRNNEGFGWSGDRKWVKNKFKKLISAGLVNFSSVRNCRDYRYTSWYFYDSNYILNDLVDAGCYVRAHKLAMIKHY